MLRRTAVLALMLSLGFTLFGFAPAQAEPPMVTEVYVSNPTIYPAIGNAKRPGSTLITIAGDDTVDHLEIRNGSGTAVRTLPLAGTAQATWNGRDDASNLVAAGTYVIAVLNAVGEASPTVATVVVSRQRLVRKTFTKLVLPTQARIAKVVGKCSTLRTPSKRGWKGSVGYYANSKCKTQSWKASSVITGHAVRLPGAERYVDVRVDTYGAAAKAKPGSRGAIEYFSFSGWTAGKFAGSKVGWHNGITRGTTNLVDSDRYFAWRFATAFKSQYDVAKFRVVVRYDALSAS